MLSAFSAELTAPGIGPGLGEGEVAGVGAREVGRELPVDLGVPPRIGLVPVFRLAHAVIDVVEGPEGGAGSVFRGDAGADLVPAGRVVRAGRDRGPDPGGSAVVFEIAGIEVPVGFEAERDDRFTVVEVLDQDDVVGCDTAVVTTPCLAGDQPAIGIERAVGEVVEEDLGSPRGR